MRFDFGATLRPGPDLWPVQSFMWLEAGTCCSIHPQPLSRDEVVEGERRRRRRPPGTRRARIAATGSGRWRRPWAISAMLSGHRLVEQTPSLGSGAAGTRLEPPHRGGRRRLRSPGRSRDPRPAFRGRPRPAGGLDPAGEAPSSEARLSDRPDAHVWVRCRQSGDVVNVSSGHDPASEADDTGHDQRVHGVGRVEAASGKDTARHPS